MNCATPADEPQLVNPAARFAKTEAGRAEIRSRALPLSRPARNLLLIIDASRSGEGWLAMVQGCGLAELQVLVDAGLVAVAVPGPGGAASATADAPAASNAPSSAPAEPRMSLAQALATKSPAQLYARITAEARPRLGLLKGYRLILDLERCSGPEQTRALAARFVEMVRANDGDSAGMALAQVLIAPD